MHVNSANHFRLQVVNGRRSTIAARGCSHWLVALLLLRLQLMPVNCQNHFKLQVLNGRCTNCGKTCCSKSTFYSRHWVSATASFQCAGQGGRPGPCGATSGVQSAQVDSAAAPPSTLHGSLVTQDRGDPMMQTTSVTVLGAAHLLQGQTLVLDPPAASPRYPVGSPTSLAWHASGPVRALGGEVVPAAGPSQRSTIQDAAVPGRHELATADSSALRASSAAAGTGRLGDTNHLIQRTAAESADAAAAALFSDNETHAGLRALAGEAASACEVAQTKACNPPPRHLPDWSWHAPARTAELQPPTGCAAPALPAAKRRAVLEHDPPATHLGRTPALHLFQRGSERNATAQGLGGASSSVALTEEARSTPRARGPESAQVVIFPGQVPTAPGSEAPGSSLFADAGGSSAGVPSRASSWTHDHAYVMPSIDKVAATSEEHRVGPGLLGHTKSVFDLASGVPRSVFQPPEGAFQRLTGAVRTSASPPLPWLPTPVQWCTATLHSDTAACYYNWLARHGASEGGITTKLEAALFTGHAAHESLNFMFMAEPSSQELFCGRGPLMVRGERMYREAAAHFHDPRILSTPAVVALDLELGMLVALWFWNHHVGKVCLNEVKDACFSAAYSASYQCLQTPEHLADAPQTQLLRLQKCQAVATGFGLQVMESMDNFERHVAQGLCRNCGLACDRRAFYHDHWLSQRSTFRCAGPVATGAP